MVVNIEDFKKGCRVAGGELEEKTRTLVCELNEDEKIVMNNKGKWVKTYGLDYRSSSGSLHTWSVPTEIIVDEEDKSMEIVLASGKSILAGIQKQTRFHLPQKPTWEVSLIIDEPDEMLPEFKELWMKQRYAARRGALRMSEINLDLGAVRRNLGLPVLKDNIKIFKK